MHVGARSARLDEPVAGIGIPAGSGTLRRIYDHRIGKPDQLWVARRTGQCERCRNRSYADLIVEVNTAIGKA